MKPDNMNGWVPRKLNELGFVGRGKSRHRPRNAPELYGGPYPFFQTGDIKAADLYLRQYGQTYSEIGLAQSKLWEPGTLCITIAANIADTAILGIKGCFPDSVVGFIPYKDKSDVRFVKYYIDTIKLQMQNVSKGTTQDNLSLDKLLTFDFIAPDVTGQQKVASVLSAYDDLIENNTRRIAILEAMAQAVYQEWFVKFRFPGHEKVKLVDSPLGKIPAGWKPTAWGQLATLEYGKAIRGYEDTDAPFPVFGTNGPIGWHDKSLCNTAGIIIGRKGAYRGVHYSSVPFWVIDTAFYLKPRDDSVDLLWAFYHLLHVDINSIDSGSAIPSTSRDAFYAIPVVFPTTRITNCFRTIVGELLSQCTILKKKNRNLRTTRNLLLPKLISGQLDVEDLDIETGEAVTMTE